MKKAACAFFMGLIWYDAIAATVDAIDGLPISHIVESHLIGIAAWGTALILLRRHTKELYRDVRRFLSEG